MKKEKSDLVFRRIEELERYFSSQGSKNEKASKALTNFRAKLHQYLGRKYS